MVMGVRIDMHECVRLKYFRQPNDIFVEIAVAN